MDVEWDSSKAHANAEKHGVTFDEAAVALAGWRIDRVDDRFDYGEVRVLSLCKSADRVLVVAHTERGQAVRIISARPANRKERGIYHAAIQDRL